MSKPAKRPAKRARSVSPSFPEKPSVSAGIPQRDSQHPDEALAARSLWVSGNLERRMAQLDRALGDPAALAPASQDVPKWETVDKVPTRAFTTQEWNQDHPAPADGWQRAGDPVPMIRSRLADARRHATAGSYLAAVEAWNEAEALYRANEPAIRAARRRIEEAQRQARTIAWSRSGSETLRTDAAPQREKILRAGMELRKKPQFQGPRKYTVLAKQIRRDDATLTVDVRQIRRILSAAGV